MKNIAFAVLAAASIAAPAHAQDAENTRDGLHIEARATWETPTVSSVIQNGDVYKLGSAFAFGGEAGYDVAIGKSLTFGPYAQYEFSNVENCDGATCLAVEDYVEFGGTLGYVVSPNGTIYGKLGYGKMGLEATDGTVTVSDSGSGIAFALGYEHGFGKNFYGRVEGGYADLGQIGGVNFQRRHFGLALGARF